MVPAKLYNVAINRLVKVALNAPTTELFCEGAERIDMFEEELRREGFQKSQTALGELWLRGGLQC